MLTRRRLLQGTAVAAGAGLGIGGYALAEPWQLVVTRYRLTPPGWPPGLQLKLALIADLHVCEPWMGIDRLSRIVARTNELEPDTVMLLGDFRAGSKMMRFSRPVADRDWAGALAGLNAPFGVHAVLGNHDWWDDPEAQRKRQGPTSAGLALEAAGIPVYENAAVRRVKDGHPFWIAGLGDQYAFWQPRPFRRAPPYGSDHVGVDDLAGALASVTDDAPVILMAHEPDVFPDVPARVGLTVAGHTHGGQIRVLGYAPHIPSIYGGRFDYGHIVEEGRNLIVSGGLGCSAFPARFGVPPEIVIVELGSWSAVAQS